jgi:sterol O-acyltransferase
MARSASAKAPPIVTSRSSSSEKFEKVPQLVGHMDEDGTAHLEPDSKITPTNPPEPPQSLKKALDAAVDSGRESSPDAGSESQSEEDYDALTHDPNAIVVGGKGGGFAAEANGKGLGDPSVEKSFEEIKAKSRPGAARLKSIPITINKLKEKGRYILTADNDALREILRIGIERVCGFMGMWSESLLTPNRRRIQPLPNGGVNSVIWSSHAVSQHSTDRMLSPPTHHSMDFSRFSG